MTWTPTQYVRKILIKKNEEKHFRFIQDKTRLLVCLKNGVIYEFEGPGNIKFDISTSYLIESQLPVRIFRFRSIKSRLRVRNLPRLFCKKK